MRALQFSEYGAPDVLHVVDVPEPHAGPGQIRIAVRAVAVNPYDWKVRSGMMKTELPSIPGLDVSGLVDEVGDGVSSVAIGDEVFGAAVKAGSAEFAVLEHFAAKPASLSWEEASGYPTAVETAVRALDLLGVADGTTLLVNGAAGGVGSTAVQFAVGRGARVIGTASESNHDYLRSLGAEPTAYGDGLADRVRALAPNGVDAAFDTAGVAAPLIELVPSPSDVVSIADFGAAGSGVRVTSGSEGQSWHALAEAAALFEAGRFSLPVEQAFPLAHGAEAHRVSEGRHVRGKLVLTLD